MKVLQLSKYYPPTHGGLELVAEFFSRAASEAGHEVTVVSLGQESKQYEGRFGEKVLQSKEDIKLSSSPLSWKYFSHVKEELQRHPPDIVYIHLPHPLAHEIGKWFKALTKEKGIKVVGIYHSDIINQVFLRDAYNLHFSRHLDLYDYFICSSPNLKRSSPILSGLPDSKVKIVPFCIDHPFIRAAVERPLKFQGKFISIGRMVPYKGYEFLIKCFNSLPYQLTLVGQGPLKSELQKIAGPNIKFVGAISEEEKFDLLKQQDALIMSSINRSEAYGMTIVEAFSVGLPVIASNVDTGVSFLVRHGITGLKFPIGDAESLKTQMRRLESDPRLALKFSQECFSFFQKELVFDAFKNNLRPLFENV